MASGFRADQSSRARSRVRREDRSTGWPGSKGIGRDGGNFTPVSGPWARSASDGIEDGLERADTASQAGGVDDGSHVGLAGCGPHGAVAVCDLALDYGGPEGSFARIVWCALLRCTILPGSSPGRQTLAPAGSTRGGSGGDEWSEALYPSGKGRGLRNCIDAVAMRLLCKRHAAPLVRRMR